MYEIGSVFNALKKKNPFAFPTQVGCSVIQNGFFRFLLVC